MTESQISDYLVENKEEGMDEAAWAVETMKDTFCYILDKAVIDGEEKYAALITEDYLSGLFSTIGAIKKDIEELEKKIEKRHFLNTF